MDRRHFFVNSAALAAGGLTGISSARAAGSDTKAEEPRIKNYRPLFKGGPKVSDISFGGTRIHYPEVLDYSINLGINFIHTGPGYANGNSIVAFGKVMKTRRKDVILGMKWGHGRKKAQLMKVLDDSLKTLNTDHIDALFSNGNEGIEGIKESEMFETFELAKEQGKASYHGLFCHNKGMEEVVEYAIGLDRFQCMTLAVNFMRYPRQPEIFKKAAAKGIGIIAMKARGGAEKMDLTPFKGEGVTQAQAAFKWAISNPEIPCVLGSISSFDEAREYVGASGQPMRKADLEMLDRYRNLADKSYCRIACGECIPGCPGQVDIPTVMRYAMYYENYGIQGDAMRKYARLGKNKQAAACDTCTAPCESRCPYGLPVKDKLVTAHKLLTV
jgi:predicted aldo/keto reductase-like oxidoreductase